MGGMPEITEADLRLRDGDIIEMTLPCGRVVVMFPRKKNGRFFLKCETAHAGKIIVRTRKLLTNTKELP